jgi:enoyl-CoA hydratase
MMTLTFKTILTSTEENIALEQFERDEKVRAIVLTGSDRAFAAGADIKEMSDETSISIMLKDQFAMWDRVKDCKKPIIAAVSGFCLGGGCELAMTCDIIVASETAQFGQPEINIGVIPGAGGTQRLTRAVGKYKAMEMVLTGRNISAQEAHQWGLVNKVVPVELYLEEAKNLAKEIAKKPPIAVRLAKEAVLKTFDVPISEGLMFERKNFYTLFSSQDQKEGMKAFLEKRPASFIGK